MKFLSKSPDSELLILNLSYEKTQDRPSIRNKLLSEQGGFCAYSEIFIREIDKCDIEHFYPKSQYPEKDNYWNWYAVISWVNEHKPKKIVPFLPILPPYSTDLSARIWYQDGIFICKPNDKEAENLIKFLGMNKVELFNERNNHLNRIKSIQKLFDSDDEFLDFITSDRQYLSFISALEIELKLNLMDYLR